MEKFEVPTKEENISFFVGPIRCGTTWLYQMFKKYTNCSYLPGKELYLLDNNNIVSSNDYTNHFLVRGSSYVDISPTYIFSRRAALNIKKFFPYSNIIIIKRRSPDIAISQFLYLRKNGYHVDSFEDFMLNDKYHYLRERIKYSNTIPFWQAEFNGSNMIYFDYADFTNDSIMYFKSICERINVEINTNYLSDMGIVNSSYGVPKCPKLYRKCMNFGKFLSRFISREILLIARYKIFDRIFIRSDDQYLISYKERAIAEDYYSKDVEFLLNISSKT